MSLCTREQHALTAIEDALRRSDPGLAGHLASFNRFNAGEQMPRRELLPERRRGLAAAFLVLVVTVAGLLAVLMGTLSGPGAVCPAHPSATGAWLVPQVHGSACPARGRVTRPAPFTSGPGASRG
jgi:DUF3040 family protein